MEEKEDETPKERAHKDSNGQTELHKLASQSAADLTTLLNMGYNLADRDMNNQTARDIAEEHNIKENVDAIGKHNSRTSAFFQPKSIETFSHFSIKSYVVCTHWNCLMKKFK